MLLQMLVVVTVLRGLHLAGAHEPLGLGYRITSISELGDGDGVVAQLELIGGCETYGPDIKELRLTARSSFQSVRKYLRASSVRRNLAELHIYEC